MEGVKKTKIKCTVCSAEVVDIHQHHRKVHKIYVQSCKKLPLPFACDHCFKSFGTTWQLRKHLLNHPPERDPIEYPFQCEECDAKFKLKFSLKQHKIRKHYESEEARVEAKGANNFIYFIETVNNYSLKEKVRCEYCGKYLSKVNISAHWRTIHPKEGKFSCHWCNKLFYTIFSRNRHVCKDGERRVPYVCRKSGV